MFSKLENGALVPFQSLSPYYVASTSQTHAPPQVSASEPPPQARVQPPSQTPSAPPTRALISTVQQTGQFWETENGTLTPLQSLSPHFVASSTSQTHAPPQPRVQALSQIPSTPPTRAVKILMHKNDLNGYCQKLRIPFPVYKTKAEGYVHELRFRSTVYIGERRFASPNTFANKKSAEQDVAKLALERLLTEDEAWSKRPREDFRKLVRRDLARCRMILNEFAVKIKKECKYETVHVVEELPEVYVSKIVLNGTYRGEGGKRKSKKEAEQIAARGAILSLLDDPAYARTISKVIKSKLNSVPRY